jgi:CDP-diacylglycerol---glycerol-3-phosphate 3-phosphatidyltransferase
VARIGLANALTLSRFVLAPMFAVVFSLTIRVDGFRTTGIVLLWLLFALIELSDVLDGAVARRRGTVTDIGKILDPFADVVSKITYFTCLLTAGIVPLWFLLVVLYREFGIILIRMILYRDGVALGARVAGKLKTWLYAVTAGAGILFLSLHMPPALTIAMLVLLILTAAASIGSFLQYLTIFLREMRARQ